MRRSTILVFVLLFLFVPIAVFAAGGTFTDDDTSVFEADIEWLADAGITLGCNPPANDNFCPRDPVTRGQMAAFMHRLSVNQVVDAATAIDAEKLDGLDSAAFLGATTKAVDSDKLDGIDSAALLPDGTPPVGTTARGNYALAGAAGWAWDSISWGFEMPTTPTVHWLTVGSAATADCPGTPANPQAAEGHLCVYEDAALNAAHHEILSGGTNTVDTADTFGAVLHVEWSIADAFRSTGTWAITVGTP